MHFYGKGHVDGAKQHPGYSHVIAFATGFLDPLVVVVKLKLTRYLTEPGVCVSTAWAQNENRWLDCNLGVLCHQICGLI